MLWTVRVKLIRPLFGIRNDIVSNAGVDIHIVACFWYFVVRQPLSLPLTVTLK